MKRFWLVLLSLGLVMAFSVSAFAVDVKFSGEYYAAGMYIDRINVNERPANAPVAYGWLTPAIGNYMKMYNSKITPAMAASYGMPYALATKPMPDDVSTAFFYQRFRLGTDFIVSPCLKLVTRLDAMERVWGADRTFKYGDLNAAALGSGDSIFGTVDQENISFDIAYIDYTSPIGLFQVGYMPDYMWGTIWGNRTTGPTAGQIKYFVPVGPVTLVAAYAKENERDYSSNFPYNDYFRALVGGSTFSSMSEDRDYDSYRVGFIYNFKGNNFAGEAGALFIYNNDSQNRDTWSATTAGFPTTGGRALPFQLNVYYLQPYFKAKIGPVALQGELWWMTGKAMEWEEIPGAFTAGDVKVNSLSAFLDGDANFGIFSVGGSFAYVSGDGDPTDNVVRNAITGGRDWDPCLIMFNNTTLNSWVGGIGSSYVANNIGGEMANAWFGQLRGSVTPVPQFTAALSVSYAIADRTPTGYDNDYGWEIDLTGTYRITNNLTYMLGAAYLFTGDYYQGNTDFTQKGNPANDVNDDYMLINRLTLNF